MNDSLRPLNKEQKEALLSALGLDSLTWFVEEFFRDQILRRMDFSGCRKAEGAQAPLGGVRIHYQKSLPRRDMGSRSLISQLFPYPLSLMELALYGPGSDVAVEWVGDLGFLRGLFDGIRGLGERLGPSAKYVVEWESGAEKFAVFLQTDRRRRVTVGVPESLRTALRAYHGSQQDASELSQAFGVGCRYALIRWSPQDSGQERSDAQSSFRFDSNPLAPPPSAGQIRLFSSESPGNSPR